MKRGYKEIDIKTEITRIVNVQRSTLLNPTQKECNAVTPFITTYNRTLSPVKHILHKYWNILQLNGKFQKSFENKPMISYWRNQYLRDIIGGNRISKNKVIRKKTI